MKKLKFIIVAALVAALLVPGFAFAAENSPTRTPVTVTPVSSSSVYDGTIKSVKVRIVKSTGKVVYTYDKSPSANAGVYKMGHKVGDKMYYYTYVIKRAPNVVTTSPKAKTYSYSYLKKSNYSFNIKTTTLSKGKLTYGSSSSKIVVSTKGKVTIKKGISKGTYKIAVRSAARGNYNKGVKYITITVK